MRLLIGKNGVGEHRFLKTSLFIDEPTGDVTLETPYFKEIKTHSPTFEGNSYLTNKMELEHPTVQDNVPIEHRNQPVTFVSSKAVQS